MEWGAAHEVAPVHAIGAQRYIAALAGGRNTYVATRVKPIAAADAPAPDCGRST